MGQKHPTSKAAGEPPLMFIRVTLEPTPAHRRFPLEGARGVAYNVRVVILCCDVFRRRP
jgi:hypothetical protein